MRVGLSANKQCPLLLTAGAARAAASIDDPKVQQRAQVALKSLQSALLGKYDTSPSHVVLAEEAEDLPSEVTLNVGDVSESVFEDKFGVGLEAAIAAQLDVPLADVQIASSTASTSDGKPSTAVVVRLLAPPARKSDTTSGQHNKDIVASMRKAVSKQLKVPESKATVESVAEAKVAPTLVTLSVSTAAVTKLDHEARTQMVASMAEEMGVTAGEVHIVEIKPKRRGKTEIKLRVSEAPLAKSRKGAQSLTPGPLYTQYYCEGGGSWGVDVGPN